VSDTWDYFHVLTEILAQLKDEIMSRNGKLVIRPDSGDPVDIVCGTSDCSFAPNISEEEYQEVLSKGVDLRTLHLPEEKGSIQILWEIFGGTVNDAGYCELDSHIG